MSDASVVAKEANRVILAMRLRAEKAEADAEALAEAAEKHLRYCERCVDPDCEFYSNLESALARYRGEK